MLTPDQRTELDAYAIGAKLRELRHEKKMALADLGRHAALSAALLSKVERGKLYPTLPTLLRICAVLGVGLDHFFGVPRQQPPVGIVRRRERLRFPDAEGTREPAFHFESLDFTAPDRQLSAYLADFPRVALNRLQLHQHPGGEFIFVLRGTLSLHIGGIEHVLDAEDSVYFDPAVSHGYRRHGERPCTAVVVVTR